MSLYMGMAVLTIIFFDIEKFIYIKSTNLT